MTFYNKLKSPLIERIIKCKWIDIITNGLSSFIRNTIEMAIRCDGKIQNIKFKKIELLAGTLVKPKGDNPNTDNSISVAKLLYFFEYLMI